jgi:hypothetical protein
MVRIVATPGFLSKLGQAKLLWGVNVQWDVSNRWIIRLVQLVVEGWRSFCCLNPFLRVLLGFRKSPLYPKSCFWSSLECSGGSSRHSGDACARACYDPFDSAARVAQRRCVCAYACASFDASDFWRALPCRLAFWSTLSDRRRIVFVSIKLIGLSQNELKLSKFEYRWVDDLC